jgi:peptidoglycan biosynthesis protein MviN/MurJ (putative lipid II flippase)
VSALFIVLAPYDRRVRESRSDRSLAVGLSQVLFPIVRRRGLGDHRRDLNTYNHFTVPALSPVVWNAPSSSAS